MKATGSSQTLKPAYRSTVSHIPKDRSFNMQHHRKQIPFLISNLAVICPRCYGNNSAVLLKNTAIPPTRFNTVMLLSLTIWILLACCIPLGVLQENLMQKRYFRSKDMVSVSLLHIFAIPRLCETSYGIWHSSVTFATTVRIVSHLHSCVSRRMEFNAKAMTFTKKVWILLSWCTTLQILWRSFTHLSYKTIKIIYYRLHCIFTLPFQMAFSLNIPAVRGTWNEIFNCFLEIILKICLLRVTFLDAGFPRHTTTMISSNKPSKQFSYNFLSRSSSNVHFWHRKKHYY